MLQHAHPVADADAERTARTAFADDHADHRRLQPRHLQQVVGDQLRLSAFLGTDAGIGAGGVDQQMTGRRNLAAMFMTRRALR